MQPCLDAIAILNFRAMRVAFAVRVVCYRPDAPPLKVLAGASQAVTEGLGSDRDERIRHAELVHRARLHRRQSRARLFPEQARPDSRPLLPRPPDHTLVGHRHLGGGDLLRRADIPRRTRLVVHRGLLGDLHPHQLPDRHLRRDHGVPAVLFQERLRLDLRLSRTPLRPDIAHGDVRRVPARQHRLLRDHALHDRAGARVHHGYPRHRRDPHRCRRRGSPTPCSAASRR